MKSEQIPSDLERSDDAWRIGHFCYFNPVGTHDGGLIGKELRVVPSKLKPFVAQIAVGSLNKLHVYGGDYATAYYIGARDYMHVMDLKQGHVVALSCLFRGNALFTANLRAGPGYSVLEVIRVYERASSRQISFEIVERRTGDVATYCADASLAALILGWRASRGIDEMCADSWRWQSMNPVGLSDA